MLALAPSLHADTFHILDDEDEALQCRIDMISNTKNELLLSTYIFEEDEIGLAIMQLLTEASSRGVRVKIILDAFGCNISNSLLNYMALKGVEIKMFNKARLFEWYTFTDRMHGKVQISDSQCFISGGRNLSAPYFALGKDYNFQDREVYVKSNNTSEDVRNFFLELWNNSHLTAEKDVSKTIFKDKKDWAIILSKALEELLIKKKMVINSNQVWDESVYAEKVYAGYDRFIIKKTDGRYVTYHRKNRRGTRQLIALIDSAKNSIDIENPYFKPTIRWKKAFERAIDRGVKIRLLTNSPCTNDVTMLQAVYEHIRPQYHRMGIEIWEFGDRKKWFHTKSFVIDNRISIIGSYNLHKVAERNNVELSLWVKSEEIARQNSLLMENYMSSAKRYAGPAANKDKSHRRQKMDCLNKRALTTFLRYTIVPLIGWAL